MLAREIIQLYRAGERDFQDKTFCNIDLSGNKLEKIDFQGSLITKASFQNTILKDADFNQVKLRGVTFENAQLQKANFKYAKLAGVNFENATLRGVNLAYSILHECNFRNADLYGADLRNITLEYTDISEAKNLNKAKYIDDFIEYQRNVISGNYLTDEKLREQRSLEPSDYIPVNGRLISLTFTKAKAKELINKEIHQNRRLTRSGQTKFREQLLSHYNGCAITGCQVPQALEAAHIIPYCLMPKGKKYLKSNGLLLRADIHTLFDFNLIKINLDNNTIIFDTSLINCESYGKLYEDLCKKVNTSSRPKLQLPPLSFGLINALRWRWNEYGKFLDS